ncbi:MAG: transposase domain-containing protein [Acidobacteriia bacterium]|nr:transposase domain-containing protein [Terriglobia bacterium]
MYRLRQMDVDDKVCEQVSPGILERIYPKEVIEQCVQESEQWAETQRRVRQSTGLSLVLFVMMLALWSRLNQRQVWQKLVGGRKLPASRGTALRDEQFSTDSPTRGTRQ